jgi:hypothetical protein
MSELLIEEIFLDSIKKKNKNEKNYNLLKEQYEIFKSESEICLNFQLASKKSEIDEYINNIVYVKRYIKMIPNDLVNFFNKIKKGTPVFYSFIYYLIDGILKKMEVFEEDQKYENIYSFSKVILICSREYPEFIDVLNIMISIIEPFCIPYAPINNLENFKESIKYDNEPIYNKTNYAILRNYILKKNNEEKITDTLLIENTIED